MTAPPTPPRPFPDLPDDAFEALVDLVDRNLPIDDRELELATLERRWPTHVRSLRRAFDGTHSQATSRNPAASHFDDDEHVRSRSVRIASCNASGAAEWASSTLPNSRSPCAAVSH
ncbi:MAG: hypothetical protein IPM29_01150 [Planctomycetes bacterium]|nr:hypothetical protein [Planctomycetota bacterium]